MKAGDLDVYFEMLTEVSISAEAFLQVCTFVRFLSSVSSLVPDQIEPLTEGLTRAEILIRLLFCARPLMSHQGGVLTEHFPTGKKFFSSVCSLVSKKVGAKAKTHSTFPAPVCFLSWLDSALLCHTAALMSSHSIFPEDLLTLVHLLVG